MTYEKVLRDSIEKEIRGEDYIYSEADAIILKEMLREINRKLGTAFQYLAEIDAFDIHESGSIMARYFDQFQSEGIRAYLIPQIVSDKVNGWAEIALQGYLNFKKSDVYISPPGVTSSAYIYVRYDNVFRQLKNKKMANELVKLAHNPRDVLYLPLTMKMLASWKIPEMEDILIALLDDSSITADTVGLTEDPESYYPPLSFIKRQLMFIALIGLKYYPSEKNKELMKGYINSEDRDIQLAASKTYKSWT